MANKPEKQTPMALRYALCVITLFLSFSGFYVIVPRFISQLYYTEARRLQKDKRLDLALNSYQKAVSYQQRNNMARKGLAQAMLIRGMSEKSAQESFYYTQNAEDEYVRASFYNPMDAEIAYGLARAENRMESLYHTLHPEEKHTPYDALPYLYKAIRLRPNSITFHYAMARYLYQHDDNEALFNTVRDMARIYPPVYHYLKKEPFWHSQVKEAVKSGLLDAIHQQLSTASAHKNLALLLEEDKEWDKAIFQYQKALEFKDDDTSAEDYVNLGRLFLENHQIKKAQLNFIKGLYVSPAIEKTFSAIGRIFKDTNHMDDYYAFYEEINARFLLSPEMQITSACYLIDMKQYRRAKRILTNLNKHDPDAKAYYWLARISETEKDLDAMELQIQKATVLDPSNMNYRRVFYGLLKRMGKMNTAEREIDLMIQHSDTPSPRLFDERAKLKQNRKDYAGAVEDWKSAIRLEPKNAAFYANIAETYVKLGNLPLALEYYQQAIQLDPGNKGYAGKYKKLKDGSS